MRGSKSVEDHSEARVGDSSLKPVSTFAQKEPSPPSDSDRDVWGNKIQFLCTTLGLAVGLGNVWRFPALAFENGGSAFLIPYLIIGAFFALPMVYSDFIEGQFTQQTPAKAIRRYAPAFEGIGLGMTFQTGAVAVYYNVIIAWTMVYMFYVVTGQSSAFGSCTNEWNTPDCFDLTVSEECAKNNTFYYNLKCVPTKHNNSVTAPHEFFVRYITNRSAGIEEINGFITPSLIALIVTWGLIIVVLIKGIEYLGKISYITVSIPYLVIVILFIRGVTLENASEGIKYFLKPDFDKIFRLKTWSEALNQCMFSIGIGFGGLITLSSYNSKKNNCFRDALVIVIGDTTMSLMGGIAVFSVLGFMAKKMNVHVTEVVKSGPTLAFVAYPGAISQMPLSGLFFFLFFLMIFLLGISSELALVQMVSGAIIDYFPRTQKRQWMVSTSVCLFLLLIGLLFVTDAGWYWFALADTYAGGIGVCITAFSNIVMLMYVYGRRNMIKDLTQMIGEPSKNFLLRFFSAHNPIIPILWITVCPLFAGAAIIYNILQNTEIEYDNDHPTKKGEKYPPWCQVIGWILIVAVPVITISFLIRNLIKAKSRRQHWKAIFRPQPSLDSYDRINDDREREKSFIKRIFKRII